jgi:hypothetical protein
MNTREDIDRYPSADAGDWHARPAARRSEIRFEERLIYDAGRRSGLAKLDSFLATKDD